MVRGDNSLFFATGLDNSGLKQGVFDATNIIKSLAGSISKINPFAALAVGAVSAFAIIANGAYNLAKDFEQAMKEVETISGAVQEDFNGIAQAVFDLSKITPDGPEKLARAYYQIVSAGYDGAEGLQLLEISAKAAVAGVTDTATAADGITTILNAFKIAITETESVSDSLFNTVKLGKTTFGELSSSISQVAPIAAASNIPLNEILSTIATLTKQGVPTAQATTQIRAAIVGLQKAGSLDGTKTFQENMQSLYDTVSGNQTVLLKEVGSIEAVQAILAVAGKNAVSATKDLESYQGVIGATEEAFKRMASSNVNQWAILGNRIKATTKGIGDVVLNFSSGLAEGLNDLLEPMDSVLVGLEKERLELLKLESKIKDTNTTQEDRIGLIKQLKEQYPGLLKEIDAETISNQELTVSIKAINDQLINKIILQRKDVEIEKQNEDIADRRLTLIQQEEKVREQLVKLSEKNGKTIKDNATLEEQAIDLISQFSANEKQGGRLTNNVVEFSFQLRQLQEAQKLVNAEDTIGNKLLEERDKLAKRLGVNLLENNKVETPDPTPNPNLDPELKTYEDFLSDKAKLYEEYENYIVQLGKQKADERYKTLLSEGNDYSKFLQSELEKTTSFEKEKAIVSAAQSAGVELVDREKIEKLEFDIKPIKVDIEIDDTSIKYIQNLIEKFNDEFEKSKTDTERSSLAEKIKIEQKKLEAAQKYLKEEESIYENLQRSISDLRNKELRSYIQLWEKKLSVAEKGSAAAAEAEGNIQQATDQIGQNTADTIGQINGLLSEASSIFRKFGEEDVAQLLDQLSGVALGIGTIAASGGNPFAIAKGALEVLNSALTVEVVSDTAKFEAAIADLEKAIDKLDYVISKSLGQDKVTSRLDAINDLKELEEQAKKAQEAELKARKETKLLGITIAKKGEGSGTDASKLEELEAKAEEARRTVEELRNELNELYTGSTSQSLADSIIDGFKEGKRSAEDFADTFEELMRNAIFEALKIKYLEKASNDFFEQFGALAGDDDGLTAKDINDLSTYANSIFNKSIEELEALNQILEEAGIAGGVFGDTQKTGLAGQISTITEDTANILAGTINSIRIDVANGIAIAQQSSLYLAAIVQNTSYNKYLESIDNRMKNVESSLSSFEASGLGG